jgi:hypothetical protein
MLRGCCHGWHGRGFRSQSRPTCVAVRQAAGAVTARLPAAQGPKLSASSPDACSPRASSHSSERDTVHAWQGLRGPERGNGGMAVAAAHSAAQSTADRDRSQGGLPGGSDPRGGSDPGGEDDFVVNYGTAVRVLREDIPKVRLTRRLTSGRQGSAAASRARTAAASCSLTCLVGESCAGECVRGRVWRTSDPAPDLPPASLARLPAIAAGPAAAEPHLLSRPRIRHALGASGEGPEGLHAGAQVRQDSHPHFPAASLPPPFCKALRTRALPIRHHGAAQGVGSPCSLQSRRWLLAAGQADARFAPVRARPLRSVIRAAARALYSSAIVELLRVWSPTGFGGTGPSSLRRPQTDRVREGTGGGAEGTARAGEGAGGARSGGVLRARWRVVAHSWMPWAEAQSLEVIATYWSARDGTGGTRHSKLTFVCVPALRP